MILSATGSLDPPPSLRKQDLRATEPSEPDARFCVDLALTTSSSG